LKQAEVYTRAANRKKLADEYLHNVVPERKHEQNTDNYLHPVDAVASGANNRGKKA